MSYLISDAVPFPQPRQHLTQYSSSQSPSLELIYSLLFNEKAIIIMPGYKHILVISQNL